MAATDSAGRSPGRRDGLLHASAVANRCIREFGQVHGGHGFPLDPELSGFGADAKIFEICGGAKRGAA